MVGYLCEKLIHSNRARVTTAHIPRIMHKVRAFLCFVCFDAGRFYPHTSGLLHWHWGKYIHSPTAYAATRKLSKLIPKSARSDSTPSSPCNKTRVHNLGYALKSESCHNANFVGTGDKIGIITVLVFQQH